MLSHSFPMVLGWNNAEGSGGRRKWTIAKREDGESGRNLRKNIPIPCDDLRRMDSPCRRAPFRLASRGRRTTDAPSSEKIFRRDGEQQEAIEDGELKIEN